jgi:hypothetical protein
MTRIFTFGLEKRDDKDYTYLVILVAHRDSRRAARVALAEAGQRGGSWRVAHVAARRTRVRVPQGEVLGASGPFTCPLELA